MATDTLPPTGPGSEAPADRTLSIRPVELTPAIARLRAAGETLGGASCGPPITAAVEKVGRIADALERWMTRSITLDSAIAEGGTAAADTLKAAWDREDAAAAAEENQP